MTYCVAFLLFGLNDREVRMTQKVVWLVLIARVVVMYGAQVDHGGIKAEQSRFQYLSRVMVVLSSDHQLVIVVAVCTPNPWD